jgi:hypothetical protein
MRNVSDKSCRENQNTHLVFKNFLFLNSAVCKIMWKNIAERGRPHVNMAHAKCMLKTKGTKRHSEYVLLIAYPLQKCLHERA